MQFFIFTHTGGVVAKLLNHRLIAVKPPASNLCYTAAMRREIRFTIPAGRAGGALVDFLTERFTYHTRDGWLERIASDRITINGQKIAPDYRLAAGDEMVYDADDIVEPPVNTRISIVHDDDDFLVINKSGDLPVHPGGRYFNHTLWALLKTRYGVAEPVFVNRIDRETSGLVVVARTPVAAKNLRTQFASRNVEKKYLALVEGTFPETLAASGWITLDIGNEVLKKRKFVAVATSTAADAFGGLRDTPPDRCVAPDDEADWAATAFRLLSVHGPVSLIEARPFTGRLHQIRVTLQALGFPIVGDKMYGVDSGIFVRFCQGALTSDDHARMRMDRQALHAASLRIRHPRFGQKMEFDLPLPDDMAKFITN
jgi:23S rRNA-/tRNA-specific pseudouridylate synthase